MDFNAEDRVDVEEIDMDMEYDMIPMPLNVSGIMPNMMPIEIGMQEFMPMPLMKQPPGEDVIPGMMPNTIGIHQMLPGTMAGMNMMESGDEYEDIEEMSRKKDFGSRDANQILMKIEKYNPGIFRYLRMYGVPYQVAKKILRRIIRVTLMYYEE